MSLKISKGVIYNYQLCYDVLYIFNQTAETLCLVKVSSFFKFYFCKLIEKNNTLIDV